MAPRTELKLVVGKTYNLKDDGLPIHFEMYESVNEEPQVKTAKDKDAREDYEKLARLDLENEPDD